MLVLKPAPGARERLDQLSFAPDGRALVAQAGWKGVLLWRTLAAGARAELVRPPGGSGLLRAAFAADGRLFLGNDQLHAVRLDTGASTRAHTDKWHTIPFAVSPDGARVVAAEFLRSGETTVLTCWHAGDLNTILWRHEFPAHITLPPAIAADGTLVLMESRRHPQNRHWHSHRVRRALGTGDVLDVSLPLRDYVEGFAVSPDGATVAARIREFLHFMPAAGEVNFDRHRWNGNMKHFTGLAFHPSGKCLAATSNDATVKLYDTTGWEVVRAFTWDIGRVRSVAFSPDGTLAAAGGDRGKVVVWDVDA